MKAMVYERYGAAGNVHLTRISKPKPGAGEVLIEVHATSVNSWDVELLQGGPWSPASRRPGGRSTRSSAATSPGSSPRWAPGSPT